jgi:hypothetical protein
MIQLSRKRFLKIVLYLLMFLFFIYLLTTSITVLGLSKLYLLILLPLFLGMFSVVFEPEIKKHIYLKNKLLRKIEEGDVLCFDSLSEDIQKLLNMKDRQVIEEKDLLVIKNLKVKTLPIYDNLPRFGPYIFLGVLFSFVFLILL